MSTGIPLGTAVATVVSVLTAAGLAASGAGSLVSAAQPAINIIRPHINPKTIMKRFIISLLLIQLSSKNIYALYIIS